MAGKLTSSGNPLGLQFQIDWTRKNKLKDAERGMKVDCFSGFMRISLGAVQRLGLTPPSIGPG